MKDNKKFYITTPIYYASGKLHLGHCYTTVFSDAIARYKREEGADVFFLTGSDEHGQKIQRAANLKETSPQEFVDGIVDGMKDLWELMDISYDYFIRTTDRNHIKMVQGVFEKLFKQGDIYKSKYSGWYCVPCESFHKKEDLLDGTNCPDCKRPVEWMEEESYFFRATKYKDKLLKFYEDNPEFIVPFSRKQEMINSFINNNLEDVCVSRTSFDWGVKVGFDNAHVIYVWVDALSNYLSSLDYSVDSESSSKFKKFWAPDLQVIGREISRFHMIIWPMLLFALDLELPKQIHSHGWLTTGGLKMGKSMGNGFDPYFLVDRYGLDCVRYYLLKEGPMLEDASYRSERFIDILNADLTNDLGNLLSRTLKMVENSFNGVIPNKADESDYNKYDRELIGIFESLKENVSFSMSKNDVKQALEHIFNGIRRANKYIDETQPWILAKKSDNNARVELEKVLFNLCESLRVSAVLLKPFLTNTPDKIFNALGINVDDDKSLDSVIKFGHSHIIGNKINKASHLFKRYNRDEEIKYLNSSGKK